MRLLYVLVAGCSFRHGIVGGDGASGEDAAGDDAAIDAPSTACHARWFDPHLSSDGCRIYFARYTGASIDWNLYVAAMQ